MFPITALRHYACYIAIVLSSSLSVSAQFTIEQILSAPFPTDLTASAAEEKIMWVFNEAGVRNIWMAQAPDWAPRKVTSFTQDDGQALGDLLFKEDSDEIIFVRGGAPNRSGEIPNPTSDPDGAKRLILRITEDGSGFDTIAEGSGPVLSPDYQMLVYEQGSKTLFYNFSKDESTPAFSIRGSAGSYRWSPDGSRLAFVSSRGDHGYVGIYTLADHTLRYFDPTVDRDFDPVWSPDGSALAFRRVPAENGILPFMPRRAALPWSVWVHDLTSGETERLWEAPKGAGSAFRSVSADRQLFWMSNGTLVFPYEGEGWTHLWRVDVNSKAVQNLTPGEHEVQFVFHTPDQQHLLFSSNKGDINRQHIWRTAAGGNRPEQVTSTQGIQWAPVSTPGGQLFCLASSGTEPAHVARITGNGLSRLAPQTWPDGFPTDLVDPEAVVFPAADGMLIHGQLFRPRQINTREKHPAVLFFHGGSRRQMLLGFHHRGYYHNAYALNQYLASRGYFVLSVNYRSGIGYGMNFREALNYGARGASEFQDVLGAGLFMRNLPEVDPERIGLWGGSYGGYLTALGLARASDLFAAGVDIHGVHDWNVVIRNFVPSYRADERQEVAELAFQSSPMAFIEGWRSPVLLIHGDDDRNVPFSETVDLAEALRRQDVYFEQLIFPDEVHGFLLHENWLKAYRATADFFDRMLK